MSAASHSLADTFDPRRNSLNALRLALATLVVVSHSWPIGGYGAGIGIGDQDLGGWAVAGFFAISGFLITGSRIHSRSLLDYFWRRFLRIYPGFIVALLVVAFGFAPISVFLLGNGTWTFGAGSSYVLSNVALMMRQFGIAGTLQGVPFPGSWDGTLWTLFYEFLCYIGIGFLVSLVPRRFLGVAIVGILVVGTAITCLHLFDLFAVPDKVLRMARLSTFFAAGALAFQSRKWLPMTWPWALAFLALLLVTIFTRTFQAFAGIPVAYLMLYLGIRLPLHRVGARNDISYGIYIYAFPVQQILAIVFPDQSLPVAVFILLSVVLAIPFGWASWMLVEKQAMKFKVIKRRAEPSIRRPPTWLANRAPSARRNIGTPGRSRAER
ncbi:acyltransferase family protein [Lacisediminihabitans sp.]|uniref:acyltransferase family protein n=1 Tax=Lacisediminihabitans sp. TaxID=2787631 RepID=UPI00374CCFF1